MRYAIVSDIHANLTAWNAVLADLTAQGAEVIICLGDVVGYGPKPAEVLEAVRKSTNHFVMGNHDAAAVGMMDYSIFNDHAREAIEWTMTELDAEAKHFLSSVPLAIEAGEILFVHAEVSEPGRFGYIDDADIAGDNFAANEHFVTFVGHTHLPKIFERGPSGFVQELPDDNGSLDPDKRYIVNVGSVGEPRNPDDLRARYVIYDSEMRTVDFRHVEFDIPAYRVNLESTTLSLRPYFLQVYEAVVEGREAVVAREETLVDMTVTQDSASLVDLGKVSQTVYMTPDGQALASARPSRAPIYALAAIGAALVLSFVVWAMTRGVDEKEPLVAKNDGDQKAPLEKTERPAPKKIEAKPAAALPKVAKAKTPSKPAPKPAPEPTPEPKKPEPIPQPPVPEPVVKKTVEKATWHMNETASGEALRDSDGQISLLPEKDGKAIRAIAPDPVPLTQEENKSAILVGVWQEEEASGIFGLTSEKSFTFEGWLASSKLQRPVFLLGTRTGQGKENLGWHLDLRPPARGGKGDQMAFFYDSGTTRTQALAENIVIGDSSPHHFAVVWNHDASSESGEMLLYLDGVEVASKSLAHSVISSEQVHPFRIGATTNRGNLALDELRFTRTVLEPQDFLTHTPILGVEMVKSDPKDKDSWGVDENWKEGRLPEGDDNVIIQEGVTAQAESSPLAYTGSLVLKKKSSLNIRSDEGLAAIPKAPSSLVMNQDSELILRTGNVTFGPIELKGDAEIWGGQSTSGHNSTRHFEGEISGKGKLTLNGVNGNRLQLKAANSFSGGFRAYSSQSQPFMLFANANQAFGLGDVSIEKRCALIIDRELGDAISDDSTLYLEGSGILRMNNDPALYKLYLHSDETVGRFFLDGKELGEGVYSNETHPIIGGPGKLTVKR